MTALLLLGLLACQPQQGTQATAITDYEAARDVFWRSLYADGGNTLYCGVRFTPESRRGLNIEHVFPMGWVTNSLNCGTRKQCRQNSRQFNLIEADLHNLYPSRSDVNYQRSAFSFGHVGGERREFGSQCDFEVDERARLAEPAPASRGEVARAMFYMADRYRAQGLVLFKRQRSLLAQWHEDDPPSEAERRRNDRIESLQGNRNPFVDNPALVREKITRGEFN
ncbi:MAG: endonuclease I [Gammaproteobacteria bacterium]|nr:endonuclease I [Gammaproteobacteria bacterium]